MANDLQDDEDEPVEKKIAEKILLDYKEASKSVKLNPETVIKLIGAHNGLTRLSIEDVKTILKHILEIFWQFAIKQTAFQVKIDFILRTKKIFVR